MDWDNYHDYHSNDDENIDYNNDNNNEQVRITKVDLFNDMVGDNCMCVCRRVISIT